LGSFIFKDFFVVEELEESATCHYSTNFDP
jgi:hypothetical protein